MKPSYMNMTLLALFLSALALTFLPACARSANTTDDGDSEEKTNSYPAYPLEKANCKISGNITLDGTRVMPPQMDITCDAMGSGSHVRIVPDLLIGEDLGIQNAFVYVISDMKYNYEKFDGPNSKSSVRELNQIRCEYVPHVVGVMVGQPVLIKSLDEATKHNVRSPDLGINEDMYGLAQFETKFKKSIVLGKPYEVVCDRHGWMKCYVFSLRHPFYAATNEKGEFEIPKLIPGDYTVEVWHEKLKKSQTFKITLKDGGVETMAVKIKPAELKK